MLNEFKNTIESLVKRIRALETRESGSSHCASGSSFPASAIVGQYFLHTPTGRKILYQYDGTTWKPLESLGTITVYVDPSGTNDLNHGFGTGVDAFQTIAYAWSVIPKFLNGDATINISADTYTENLTLEAKAGKVTLQGIMTVLDSLSATGGVAGTANSSTTPRVDGAFTANEYDNKIIKFTSGTNNGQMRVVGLTTTTALYLNGNVLPAAPANGDTYDILDWATVISGNFQYRTYAAGGNSIGSVGLLAAVYIKFTASSGSSLIYVNTANFQPAICLISNAGATYTLRGEVHAYLSVDRCVVINTVTGITLGVFIDWLSQFDCLYSRIVGYANNQAEGIRVQGNSSIAMKASEITKFNYGIRSMENGNSNLYTSTVTNFIHDCAAYGIKADYHSMSIYTGAAHLTYAKKLDGSASANGSNSSAEAASYSWIGT